MRQAFWLLLALAVPTPVGAATLLKSDFNMASPRSWPNAGAVSAPKTVHAAVTLKALGTIDVADTTTPSGALLLSARPADRGPWRAALVSGPLPVRSNETNLGKITLSFSLSASAVRPLTVSVESCDAAGRRTGGLVGTVYPAAPDFFQRYALDLSTLRPAGKGRFQPTAPFVQFSFGMGGPAGGADAPAEGAAQLRVDNVNYATPAYYVSPRGSDRNDGRTERTAFADPQKAVDASLPGDIILLMDGTYHRAPTSSVHEGVVAFRRPGTPDAWISLKNYPGQHPVLTSDAWNAIKIGRESATGPVPGPALAYLEVRGLHIRGLADTIKMTHPELIDQVSPLTNGNGISGSGGSEVSTPHHLRFADNLVEYCCGGGIGTGNCDWVTIENNTIRNNCWWVIYATSGAGLLGTRNFDATENVYKSLIRNNIVSGNQCFRKWKQVNRYSDGNGIIIDTTYVPKSGQAYLGRTLIQNNLSFNNGGSGIHAFRSHRVDIVNNTAYYNGASPELRWGQIFVQESDDVRIMNNILVSRPGQTITSCGPGGGDQNSSKIVRRNNLYFGGLTPTNSGAGDVIADPLFVHASTDPAGADFHVRPGSPALHSGLPGVPVPLLDLDGRPRPMAVPDRGAYQR